MHLSNGHNYLAEHERHLKTKATRYKGVLCRHMLLWSFNRYGVVRAVLASFMGTLLCASRRRQGNFWSGANEMRADLRWGCPNT